MNRQQRETLAFIVGRIRDITPGYSTTFARQTINSIGPDAIDVVMQSDGFGREFSFFIDQRTKQVRFMRLSEPLAADDDRRTYVAPDQRDGFTFDGNYWRPA